MTIKKKRLLLTYNDYNNQGIKIKKLNKNVYLYNIKILK